MHNAQRNRKSIRLPGYDYRTAAIYYVTIGSKDRVPRFGDVRADATVALSPLGQIVQRVWRSLPERYPYVTMHDDIVMPDHLHGLLEIRAIETHPIEERKSLGSLIGAFKSMATNRILQVSPSASEEIWQRGFYEHIVRDAESLGRIREYILANPQRWLDRLRRG